MEPTSEQNRNCQFILCEELAKRQTKNPSYSLRAFAKSLGVSVTTLSEVINGKRVLSKSSLIKIVDRLYITPEERPSFLLSAMGINSGHISKNDQSEKKKWINFEVDRFRIISDWYPFAILSLAKIRPNKADPGWIASRLGISKSEASGAIERLLRLNLIEIIGESIVRTSEPLYVGDQVPSSFIRKYHRQNLENAMNSLEQDPIEVRDFSSITIAADPNRIEEARKLIREFREKMSCYLENDEKKEVYNLSIQLFPVSKKENSI